MRIFIYEFVTGGGCLDSGEPPTDSLLAEGCAMVQAITADFSAMDGVEVLTTRDLRLTSFHPPRCRVREVAEQSRRGAAIIELAQAADWTLLIAPESGGALSQRCEMVESVGGQLLSPSSIVVELASSKQLTADRLMEHGIPVPRGVVVNRDKREWPSSLPFPVVVKPDDGCGSQNMQLVHKNNRDSWRFHSSVPRLRIEEFVIGIPASVAVLCGPTGHFPLPACEQCLSADGRFTYLGGRLPLVPRLNVRAHRLAMMAIAVLPDPRGYIGVDLVLGNADDGSGDYVIEINPRLTTSYIGLRSLSQTNLAAAMFAVFCGENPNLSFSSEQLEFSADGVLTPAPVC